MLNTDADNSPTTNVSDMEINTPIVTAESDLIALWMSVNFFTYAKKLYIAITIIIGIKLNISTAIDVHMILVFSKPPTKIYFVAIGPGNVEIIDDKFRKSCSKYQLRLSTNKTWKIGINTGPPPNTVREIKRLPKIYIIISITSQTSKMNN